MDSINTILARMQSLGDTPAIYWNGETYSYAQLFEMIDGWQVRLTDDGIVAGDVCGVLGNYSPQTCALFFALMKARAVAVPFTHEIRHEMDKFCQIAGVQCMYTIDEQDNIDYTRLSPPDANDLIVKFRETGHPGLVVFTSGSTGEPKGILQDFERVMHKFVEQRPGWRTVLFLMMDHFGGINTLMSAFAYGGMAICIPDRAAATVCQVIEASRATLLPTTPTFLNLLIASGSYRQYDLSSVKLITYGTEVMTEATLAKLKDIFPSVKLKQTYGLSELGVLRSKSKADNSPWVKIGGAGFETKVVDNILWVRSEANMVGYLNAPDPFDGEGWASTGDHVEVQGEYMRILGRKSEMINVGGQKVFPVEVESVLLEAHNVSEATVYGKAHALMGQVVYAKIALDHDEDGTAVSERLTRHCLKRLARYKVPLHFEIVSQDDQRSERYKKIRNIEGNIS